MTYIRNIFKPRQLFRINSYYKNKRWFDLIRYIVTGYHTPFDLMIMPMFSKDMSEQYDLYEVFLEGEDLKHYKRKKKIEQL
jgi:hypothetical protein